jgi:ABC-type amino acid transport substrate-binding protein
VEIKEIKNIKQNPLVEIKIKEEPKEKVIVEKSKPVDSPKQSLLKNINEEIKKIKANGKINKEAKKELIKNLLQKGL